MNPTDTTRPVSLAYHPGIYPPPAKASTGTPLEDSILAFVNEVQRDCLPSVVAKRFQITDPKARELLSKLADEGKIEKARTYETRGATYNAKGES